MKTIVVATQEKDLIRLYAVRAKDKLQAIDKLYEFAKHSGVVDLPVVRWTLAIRPELSVQFLTCLPLRENRAAQAGKELLFAKQTERLES